MQTPTETAINARMSVHIASDVVHTMERALNPKAKWRKGIPSNVLAQIDAGNQETLAAAREDLARAQQTLADAFN